VRHFVTQVGSGMPKRCENPLFCGVLPVPWRIRAYPVKTDTATYRLSGAQQDDDHDGNIDDAKDETAERQSKPTPGATAMRK